MPVVSPPDCDGCGACCHLHVELYPYEEDRFPWWALERVGDDDDVPGALFLRRREDLSCIFLDTESKRCTIYEERPHVCRDFERECGLCFWALQKFAPEKFEDVMHGGT